MAKAKEGTAFISKPKKRRKGRHSKTKMSKSKNATHYAKAYVSQG
jgi:hypothetical protein